MSASSMLNEVRRIRDDLDAGMSGGRIVIVASVDPGWNDSSAGDILPWTDQIGANMWVPFAFDHDLIAGLSGRQRAWLRPGDKVIADSHCGWKAGEGRMFCYEFDWPCDPGPPHE